MGDIPLSGILLIIILLSVPHQNGNNYNDTQQNALNIGTKYSSVLYLTFVILLSVIPLNVTAYVSMAQ